jgi:hypothetical protein
MLGIAGAAGAGGRAAINAKAKGTANKALLNIFLPEITAADEAPPLSSA